MAKKAKDEKKSKQGLVLNIFLIISLLTSLFAMYEIFLLDSIENVLRYIVMGILMLIDLVLIFKRIFSKKKKKRRIGFIIFMLLYSLICGFVGGVIFYVYGQISSINKVYVTYTSNLITMNTNEASAISDVKDFEIGILDDKKSPEGYIIPQEIIKENKLNDENELKSYDDYTSMLVDMYSGEIDAMFVSGSYVSMFSGITGYENIESETKIIASKDKKMRKTDVSVSEGQSTGKDIKEPFTLLLMGIDSTDEVLSKNAIANGDTLILITFNPKTLNATMFSIPRDSYVPISCWSGKPENKITHAAAYGNDCMMNTIKEYFKVNIDYYAKINFKGLVKLVDAVGGVEVDVPKELCTDDSSRGDEICIQEGHQVLNGEQALVFARNRKAFANGDFARAEHQQEIIMALVNKMKQITSVKKFMEILNTISNSLDTNLTTKQILSFYNVGKDIIKKSLANDNADLVNIQRLYLEGTGQMIYDERARMVLWDYVPNESSRKDIIQAMNENLELAEHEAITEFSFSINEPYEKPVIGTGPYKTGNAYTLLPDFEGMSKADAQALANRFGVSVSFVGTSGYVVSQSYPAAKRTDLIKGNVILTLSSNAKEEDTTTTTKDKNKDKNKEQDDDDDDDDEETSNKNVDDEEDEDNSTDDTTSSGSTTTTPPTTENDTTGSSGSEPDE